MATIAQAKRSTRARWDRLLILVGVMLLIGNGAYLVDAKYFKPDRMALFAEQSEVVRKSFPSIASGQLPETVSRLMGEPSRKRGMVLRKVRNTHEIYTRKIMDGPARPLFNKLPYGSSFEQWTYTTDHGHYYVYLAAQNMAASMEVVHTAFVN